MNEQIELLTRLIACRPVTSDCKAVNKAAGILQDFLEQQGLCCAVEVIGGRKTLYASTRPGKVQDLLLNAHIDVVPAISESQYTPRFEDGVMYARGAGDCLGNAVCIAAFLSRAGRSASVGAIFTTDEEKGGATTLAMIERGYGARKAALVLDGWGDGNIVHAQKGILILKLVARGKGGHASTPWLLDNPIDKLVRGYLAVAEAWKNPVPGDTWRNSMTPCIVSAGLADNQVPETAEMTMNIRYVNEGDNEKIVEFVKARSGLDVVIGAHGCQPMCSDIDSGAMRRLVAAFKTVTGREPVFEKMNGATDARYLVKLGIPVAIIGVHGGNAHAADEFLNPESIPIYSDILAQFVKNL